MRELYRAGLSVSYNWMGRSTTFREGYVVIRFRKAQPFFV